MGSDPSQARAQPAALRASYSSAFPWLTLGAVAVSRAHPPGVLGVSDSVLSTHVRQLEDAGGARAPAPG